MKFETFSSRKGRVYFRKIGESSLIFKDKFYGQIRHFSIFMNFVQFGFCTLTNVYFIAQLLYLFISVSLYLSKYLFIHLFICLFVYLPIYLPMYIYQYIFLCIYLFKYLSIYLICAFIPKYIFTYMLKIVFFSKWLNPIAVVSNYGK